LSTNVDVGTDHNYLKMAAQNIDGNLHKLYNMHLCISNVEIYN